MISGHLKILCLLYFRSSTQSKPRARQCLTAQRNVSNFGDKRNLASMRGNALDLALIDQTCSMINSIQEVSNSVSRCKKKDLHNDQLLVNKTKAVEFEIILGSPVNSILNILYRILH